MTYCSDDILFNGNTQIKSFADFLGLLQESYFNQLYSYACGAVEAIVAHGNISACDVVHDMWSC